MSTIFSKILLFSKSATICLLLNLSIKTTIYAESQISQYGITWHFDDNYETGTFINGDYWVAEKEPNQGIVVTKITPITETANGRTSNGSMVNPAAGIDPPQGIDSSLANYQENLNIETKLPISIAAGSSIISVISHPDENNRPRLTDAAILTVVTEKPPATSFRPPYAGINKDARWDLENVDLTKLLKLNRPNSAPHIEELYQLVEKPYIELSTSVNGRLWHPINNQQHYGREISYDLSECLLSLHLDYSYPEKEPLLVSMLQLGIDIFGAAKDGGYWEDKGGHNHGRKMTMLLAGSLFNDREILEYADAMQHKIFQEDLQTFYVQESDVNDCPKYDADGRKRDCYTFSMLGMPEWGAQHTSQPERDGSNWDTNYRTIVGNSLIGHVLCARIMNLEETWNHPPLFDYMDRLWLIEGAESQNVRNEIHSFERDMWLMHRQSSTPTDPSDLTDN